MGGKHDRGMLAKDEIFDNWSYIDRVRLPCQRLIEDRLYQATWAVATSRPNCPASKKEPNRCAKIRMGLTGPKFEHTHNFGWRELDPTSSGYAGFVAQLSAHIAKYY
ncbi:hypothetical protein Adu01nite_58980 [Paractinoplanes durhamensis]|uniref:Uncharacterized protein n=1 Tax=Paractinoplanes durhamensis TaxID=113563 RepID=A0ABQ3Z3Z2_9ACTN|nr:hypothetical protein Adu01nite_58980 [Actinoplanes durhamensis]